MGSDTTQVEWAGSRCSTRFPVGARDTCVSGGASLPLDTIRSFEDEFGAEINESLIVELYSR